MIGIGTPRSQSNIPRPMDFLRLEKCLLNKQLVNSFRAIRSPKNSLRLRAVREPEAVDLRSPLANPARDAAADQRIGARRDASRGEHRRFGTNGRHADLGLRRLSQRDFFACLSELP
jgi:hypothetical protein